MRRRSIAFGSVEALALAGWLWGAAAPAAAAEATAELQGVWRPVAAVLGGDDSAIVSAKTFTVTFDGDSYLVTVDGSGVTDRGTYSVDDRRRVGRLKIDFTEGPNQGRSFLAIYELDGPDRLRICYDLTGANYPKKFESAYGTVQYLVTFARETP